MGPFMCEVKLLVFLSLSIGYHVCQMNSTPKMDEDKGIELSRSGEQSTGVYTASYTTMKTIHEMKDTSASLPKEIVSTSPLPTKQSLPVITDSSTAKTKTSATTVSSTVMPVPTDPICGWNKEFVIGVYSNITLEFSLRNNISPSTQLCAFPYTDNDEDTTVNPSCTSTLQNNTSLTVKGLKPGSKYEISIFSAITGHNETIFSKKGCSNVTVYTIPTNPICGWNKEFVIGVYTNITLEFSLRNNISSSTQLCAFPYTDNDEDKTVNPSCTSISQSNISVTVHSLNPGNKYEISIFSAITGNNETIFSKRGCSNVTVYTIPSNPICDWNNNYFTGSESYITLELSVQNEDMSPSTYLCAFPYKYNETVKPSCISQSNTSVTVQGLKPGNKYGISIFSAITGNNETIYSKNGCSNVTVHTRPEKPTCPTKDQFVTKVTKNSLTLNLSSVGLMKNDQYTCISTTLQKEKLNTTCHPIFTKNVSLVNLSSGTAYSIVIHTAVKQDKGEFLQSSKGCLFTLYTRPYINCSYGTLKDDMFNLNTPYTDSIQKLAFFFSPAIQTENVTFARNANNKYDLSNYFQPGKNYTVSMYAEGMDNLWTKEPCNYSIATEMNEVNCSQQLFVAAETEIQIDIKKCNSNWVKKFEIMWKWAHMDIDPLSIPLDPLSTIIKDQRPGSEVEITVRAFGENGKSSPPATFKVYTKPVSPNCVNVVTLTTNESITIFGDSFHAEGASTFNITMTNVLMESEMDFNVTFLELKPGNNYTFIVVSHSQHGELSNSSCSFSAVTRPNNPDCQRVIISNITTQQMIIDLSNVQSSGALRYALNVTGSGHLPIDISEKFVHNLTNLSPGTQYTFNVSSVGIGDMKSRRSCIIKKYTIPAKPGEESNVKIEPQTTYVTVDWKRTIGNVENYTFEIVCSCVASTCGICDPRVIYHFDDSFANVTRVIPGAYCNFSVAAESGGKLGETLKVQIRTSEIVPGSVTNFSVKDIALRDLTVEWKEPNCPFGEVIQYALTIINETSHPQNITIDSTNFSYTFKELKPGTFYNVSIVAVNNAGEGDATSLPIYTVESIPSEVTGLEAQNISSTTIQVSWGKPLISNGIILQYAVFVQQESICVQKIMMRCLNCTKKHPDTVTSLKAEQGSHNFPQSLDCKDKKNITFLEKESTSFSVNVSNLEYFTEYEFVVLAYTIKGPGNSSKIKKRTSEDKPAEPTNLQVVNKSKDSIGLKFNTPYPQNGRIHLLEVEYQFKTQNNCLSEGLENKNKTLPVNINSTLHETFSVKLDNLFSYWNYTIRVRMATYAGFGNFSSALTVTTEPSVPGVVRNIGFGKITSRSIQLHWETPCHPNGIIEFYEIKVNGEISSTPDPLRTSFNKFNVTLLLPYRKYSFSISAKAKNVSMKGPPAKSKDVNTSTEAAKKPENVTSDPTSVTVSLSWNPPKLETGPTFYRAVAIDKKTNTEKSNCTSRGFSNTFCVIQNLHPYRKYWIILYAFTNPYPPSNTTLIVQTDESAPGKVADFKVSQIQNVIAPRAVNLSWLPPLEMNRNGVIRSYYVKYWIGNSKESLKSEVITKPYKPNISSANITGITPERNYTFLIFPETVANATDDDQVSKTIEIVAGAPIPLQLPETVKTVSIGPSARVSDNEKQLSVYFYHRSLCDARNGIPVSWYIIVAEQSSIPSKLLKPFQDSKIKYEDFIEKEYKTWSNVHTQDHFDPYIAKSDWDPKCNTEEVKVSFLVGEQGECEGVTGYCNGFLKPGNKYKVRFAVCTRGGCLESEFSSPLETKPNLVPAIAGSVSGVVMALVVVIAVILYLKRRRKGPFKDEGRDQAKGSDNETFSTELETKNAAKPRPVKNAEFAEHVQRMHADSNLMFSNEYKLLKETCPAHTTKAAEVQVNRIKNRYTNILAFDHSRVKLLPTEDDEGSDYINANYIPGYSSQREYIATQGPLPFTRDDFWRMIWEQNVSIIVMLTQLVERGRRKCDIYWPEATREPVYYGDLVVEIESESTLPDYVLRVMSVKLGDRTKKVKQLHYLKWPDMGCPETTWLLLNFVGATRLYLPHNDPGPIVVHCSAGVGRTGTFIAVDFLMQHVSSSDVIDIYDFVMKMRNNRPNMVQTEDQYVFIHDCIRDYINRSDEDSDEENGEGQEDQENPIYANM